MKLSTKFFCTAYAIVLLSTGIGGSFLIRSVNNTIVQSHVHRMDSAVNYAVEVFRGYTDVSYEKITAAESEGIKKQINNSIEDTVSCVEILTEETVADEFLNLTANTTLSHFSNAQDKLVRKSMSKIETVFGNYYLLFESDFTGIKERCESFWDIYTAVVLGISFFSGILLFLVTRKITKPLRLLTKVTDEIAKGNYGKMVKIRSGDTEVKKLSDSINSMSMSVKEKINEIKKEIERRNTFVADFTHELKTPMTSIMGYSGMLCSYELNVNERREASYAIYNEAKRLEKLSLQLLDLYVLQNEEIETQRISLLSIEEQLYTTCKYISEKYSVALRVNFNDETVIANRELLLSLLYNLIDNAVKASPEKSTVRVFSKNINGRIYIFVKDSGRGIAKENLKMLTEPFYREDKSRSRKQGGAGLGLSLCKEIASLHLTKLHFSSIKDKGTTVSFSLKKGR